MNRPAAVPWSALSDAIRANPKRGARLLGVAASASASIAAMPDTESELAWLPGWKEDTAFTIADAVALVLWIKDPMYRNAVGGVRRTMEMEEAGSLLGSIDAAWRTRGGRHRGWVRKHLEEDLRGRSAGADPTPDFWEAARTAKRTALLLDFVCVVREIRVGLWWPTQKAVTMLPLTGVTVGAPLLNLNCESGHVMVGPSVASWPGLVTASTEITWTPPACAASVGAQTVAQVQGRLAAIGGSSVSKGKAALWTSYLWQTLVNSLAGIEPATNTVAEDPIDDGMITPNLTA